MHRAKDTCLSKKRYPKCDRCRGRKHNEIGTM